MTKLTFDQKCIKIGIYDPIRNLCKMYQKGMSANEIAEHFTDKCNISITAKSISEKIRTRIPLRNYSERKKNAIKRGRMIYYKKPEHEKYKHGNPSILTRKKVLQRDKYKCVLCGNSPSTGYTIEIHHKNGPSNDLDNLQTLCFQCHRGEHAI